MSFEEMLKTAREALAAGQPVRDANSLRFAALAEELVGDTARLATFVALIEEVAAGAQAAGLASEAQAAVGLAPGPLFDLGYELVEQGLPQLAIPVLRHVNALVPNQPQVLAELAVACRDSERSDLAVSVLLASAEAVRGDFWLRFLLCSAALDCGDLVTAEAWIEGLEPGSGDDEAAAAEGVRGVLRRCRRTSDACGGPDRMDVRAWTYGLNGTLVLHLSPFGFDDGMNGRYAYTQDSAGSIHRELLRLVDVLTQTNRLPAVVHALSDRGSAIVAAALARLVGCTVAPYEAGGGGLVVGYSTDRFEEADLQLLAEAREPLFVRAVQWTRGPSRNPDLAGFLHQTLVAPWDECSRPKKGGGLEKVPASDEPVEVWVERILASDGGLGDEDFDDLPAVRALAGLGAAPGPRWYTGPIRSSRFL